jgi:exocyst complex component 4
VACQEVLVVYLSQSKIRFLLASLSYLMGAVLINSLTKIKSINKWGVRKMCRNVFALQQNLTNIIISTDEEPFEKARKYYELLNISQEEVLVHIAENSGDISKLFSYDEYKTVLEMMSPDRQINSQMREILEQKVNEAYMHV